MAVGPKFSCGHLWAFAFCFLKDLLRHRSIARWSKLVPTTGNAPLVESFRRADVALLAASCLFLTW